MDKRGILTKIKELFSTEEEFQGTDYKTQDGRILRVMGGLDVGTEVKEITADGEIDIEDGNYVLEDGVVLMIHSGKISEVTEVVNTEEGVDEEAMGYKDKEKMEDEYKNEIDTKLVDGTEVRIITKGEAVSVGDMVLVKVGEGYKEAPEGRHELEGGLVVYTDAEGNINEIETKETEERDDEMSEVFSAMETLLNEVKSLKDELVSLKNENESLKSRVETFAKAPSAEPVNQKITLKNTSKDDKLKFFANR